MIKKVKLAQLNTKTVIAFQNAKTLKMIESNCKLIQLGKNDFISALKYSSNYPI